MPTNKLNDPAKPTGRRPQAVKSAETRARAIQGAIACIHRLGYGVTTLEKVALEAGLSRGAISHQFSTKLELMLAVVEAVYEEDRQAYAAAYGDADPAQAFRRLPELAWTLISRPAGIAVIEIMLASRSDETLAAQLREIQSQIDRQAHLQTSELMTAAGCEPRADRTAIHRVMVAALRGLAIEALVMGESIDTRASLEALLEARAYLYNQFTPGAPDSAVAKPASRRSRARGAPNDGAPECGRRLPAAR